MLDGVGSNGVTPETKVNIDFLTLASYTAPVTECLTMSPVGPGGVAGRSAGRSMTGRGVEVFVATFNLSIRNMTNPHDTRY